MPDLLPVAGPFLGSRLVDDFTCLFETWWFKGNLVATHQILQTMLSELGRLLARQNAAQSR